MTPDEYKKKREWLTKFYSEAAETGREMQVYSGFPDKWEKADGGPAMYADPSKWRLKPEPQKAWVVWNDRHAVCIASSKEEAEKSASFYGGTIQEITRPEPQ